MSLSRRALAALATVSSIVALGVPAHAQQPRSATEAEACVDDCWVLHDMSVRGAVNTPMSFELHGSVRGKGEQKIPLVGPPSQVRLEDVTIDGARATITFDGDHYYVITSARAFTLRGKVSLGA